jgi:hypothetical protein
VIDNRTGQHDISGSINPGECKNASWLYTVTDQDARNGTIVNVAYANATACGSSFEIHDNPNATVTIPVRVNSDRIGVFNTGLWALDLNGNGSWEGPPNDSVYLFSGAGWIPVIGDWNGDGNDEIGAYSDGLWALDVNGNGVWDGPPSDTVYMYGGSGWTPVVGNWDGDSTDEIGVTFDNIWALDMKGNGVWEGPPSDTVYLFGGAGWVPVTGKWGS